MNRLTTVIAALASAACSGEVLRLEVEPAGNEVVRTLSLFVERGGELRATPFKAPEAARLALLYGVSARGGLERVSGRFGPSAPDDVGGAGRYLTWTSALGSASLYAERFRGQLDLWSEIEAIARIADRVTDHLRAWLAWELAGEPGRDALLARVDVELRRDLRNLGLYALAPSLVPGLGDHEVEALGATWLGMMAQFVVERGYFDPGELPSLARAALGGDEPHGYELLRRLVAERMGVPRGDPIPASLDFLSSAERSEASHSEWLRVLGAARGLLRRLLRVESHPSDDDPLREVIEWLFPGGFLKSAPSLELALACPLEPFLTNGTWDAAHERVHWERAALHDGRFAPPFRLALWAEPDTAFQLEHLGAVLLAGEELWCYVLWERGLTADEAEEWERLLRSLEPNGWRERMRAFRFADGGSPAQVEGSPVRGLVESA